MKLSLSDPATMPPWQRRLEEGLIWTLLAAAIVVVAWSLLLCHVSPEAMERARQRAEAAGAAPEVRPVVPSWRAGWRVGC